MAHRTARDWHPSFAVTALDLRTPGSEMRRAVTGAVYHHACEDAAHAAYVFDKYMREGVKARYSYRKRDDGTTVPYVIAFLGDPRLSKDVENNRPKRVRS